MSGLAHTNMRTGEVVDSPAKQYYGVRSSLRFLLSEVRKGRQVSKDEWEANAKFATSVRDDDSRPVRDRLAAVRLLEEMRTRAITVALHLDKADIEESKPAANGPTVNVIYIAGVTREEIV